MNGACTYHSGSYFRTLRDHLPCLEFDDEEGKEQAEEQVSYRQEVAGPDVLCMVVQEG